MKNFYTMVVPIFCFTFCCAQEESATRKIEKVEIIDELRSELRLVSILEFQTSFPKNIVRVQSTTNIPEIQTNSKARDYKQRL